MKMRRIASRVGLGVAATAVGLGALTVPASAATPDSSAGITKRTAGATVMSGDYTCGSYCDGKNPYTVLWAPGGIQYRCADDAHTVDNAGIVELRWSPRCETSWARAQAQTNSYWLTIESYNGNTRRAWDRTSTSNDGSTMYTAMFNNANPLKARVCQEYGGQTWCSAKF